MKSLPARLLLSLLVLSIAGCAPASQEPRDGSGDAASGEATLDCGAVVGGELRNPISSGDAKVVTVARVIDATSVAVRSTDPLDPGGLQLVQLQGVELDPATRIAAENQIRSMSYGTVWLVEPTESCTVTTAGGGQGIVAQLISADGKSFTEELVRQGLVRAKPVDVCGGELIGSCLVGLQGSEQRTAGALSAFLWKPVADSDGRLAVHTGPYGTSVTVNGELGENQGGGNGYGSLARFSRSGCSYGAARVQVRDERTGLPYTVAGSTTFTVPNGCGRWCLEDGAIVACSK